MSDILPTAAIKEKVYKLAHFILRFLDEESLDKAANSDELHHTEATTDQTATTKSSTSTSLSPHQINHPTYPDCAIEASFENMTMSSMPHDTNVSAVATTSWT